MAKEKAEAWEACLVKIVGWQLVHVGIDRRRNDKQMKALIYISGEGSSRIRVGIRRAEYLLIESRIMDELYRLVDDGQVCRQAQHKAPQGKSTILTQISSHWHRRHHLQPSWFQHLSNKLDIRRRDLFAHLLHAL